jgi:SAM-dependent methyltransferase
MPAPDWFESFFGADYFEIYRDFFTPEATAADVEGIVSLLGLSPGARVLDLACGHGRHAVPLAARGFDVTGFDLSELVLERARAEAAARGVAVRWQRGDMRELPFEAEFDAVINVFTAFGYFADEEEDVETLRRVRHALVPGGRFLLETPQRALTARFRPQLSTTSNARRCAATTADLARDVIDDRVSIVRPDGSRGVRQLARAPLHQLLARTSGRLRARGLVRRPRRQRARADEPPPSWSAPRPVARAVGRPLLNR